MIQNRPSECPDSQPTYCSIPWRTVTDHALTSIADGNGYGDHPCSTVGCTTITDTTTGKRVSAVDIATIYFRHIDEPTIEKLIEGGEVYYCAGGLMIENPLVLPFLERVEGSEESVMGISSTLLSNLFEELLRCA